METATLHVPADSRLLHGALRLPVCCRSQWQRRAACSKHTYLAAMHAARLWDTVPCSCHVSKHTQDVGHAHKLITTARAAATDNIVATLPGHDNGQQQPTYLFRFWHDEQRFKGTGDTSLAQQTLLALGGQRVGGPIKHSPTHGPLGWQVVSRWDLLWSPSTTATKAAEQGLKPGQLASAVPGTRCITKKRLLSRTLQQAYGQYAHSITPLTYELPAQVQDWLQLIRQQAVQRRQAMIRQLARSTQVLKTDAGSQGDSDSAGGVPAPSSASDMTASSETDTSLNSWWILKTAQHLGQGVAICNETEAVKQVLARLQAVANATTPEAKRKVRPFVVAQRYIPDPMLITGRKFGLRVWVLLTQTDPLRVYMHTNGLVLFSNVEYQTQDTDNLQSHLTNYAQNVDGDVWGLEQLRQHLGPARFDRLRHNMAHAAALTFAAAAGTLRKACAAAKVPPGSVFELFGLDFLVDGRDHPWLLEVNATPSLAVEHAQPEVREMIHQQKMGMVRDMFQLLRIPQRFSDPLSQGDQQGHVAAQEAILHHMPDAFHEPEVLAELIDSELELQHAGGWQPLMHLLPKEGKKAGKWKARNQTFY